MQTNIDPARQFDPPEGCHCIYYPYGTIWTDEVDLTLLYDVYTWCGWVG